MKVKLIWSVNSKEFLQAIDRASLFAREGRNNVVKFSTIENRDIEISSNTPEIGKVVEEIKVIQLKEKILKFLLVQSI